MLEGMMISSYQYSKQGLRDTFSLSQELGEVDVRFALSNVHQTACLLILGAEE